MFFVLSVFFSSLGGSFFYSKILIWLTNAHTQNRFTFSSVRLTTILAFIHSFVAVDLFFFEFSPFSIHFRLACAIFYFSIHWNKKKTTKICAHTHTHIHAHTIYITDCYYCYVRRGRRTSHTDSCESVWACNSFNLNLVFWWCVYACITHMHSHLSLFIYLFLFSSICFVFSIL